MQQKKKYFVLPKILSKPHFTFLFLYFILSFFLPNTFADTEVGGTITEDTSWNIAGSPYIVISNVTVNQGVTLTIDPGVEVKFQGNFSLSVNGTLHAVGTSAQNITFTSNKPTPAVNDWYGIYFNDASDDATCIISYAVLEYSSNGISTSGASPRIENNTIRNNYYGVSSYNSSYSIITNNTITNNHYGIYLFDINASTYPMPTINNNSIYDNQYNLWAYSSYYSCSSVTINAQNNWWGSTDPVIIIGKIIDFIDNGASPVVDFTPFLDGPNGNPVPGNFIYGPINTDTTWTQTGYPYLILSNVAVAQGVTLTIEPGVQVKFTGNFGLTINGTLHAVGTQSQNITFTSDKTTPAIGDWSQISFTDTSDDANCIISYAVIEYSYYGISLSSASPRIENNTIRYNQNGIYAYSSSSIITNNTIQNNNTGIRCYSSSQITGNTIQNNTMYGIYCEGAYSPNIADNIIINNSIGINLYGNLTAYPTPAINNNSIYNNTSNNLYAYASNNCSSLTINAQNNWWGTTDVLAITQKIYDYSDHSYSPVVDFTPFLDGPNGNPVPGNFVYGTINTNTTWTQAQSPYIVVGNMGVSQGVTLTIEPGVQVKFAGPYNLYINGTLNAQGQSGNLITFTSNKATPAVGDWGSINFTDTSDDASCIISYAVVEYSYNGINIQNSSPRVENNTLRYNHYGIYSWQSLTSSVITHNTITDNIYGIYLDGFYPTNYPTPTVNNNSIYNNTTNFSAYVPSGYDCSSLTINAQNNWWGSTDPVVISQKIYDSGDNPYCPVVDFTPFLDGPNGNPIDGNFIWGSIRQNTTWTLSQSPYIVIGNVTVNQGATLTIEPGVQVKFAGNFSLTVNGTLNAQGTESQQIIFTSNKPSPAVGDWDRISFTDISDDATCIISYAIIEYASRGISAYDASPRIENNILRNNQYGIYCQNSSSSTITHNTILDNSYGVYLTGYLATYPNPTFNDNSVYNNSQYNLFASASNNCSSLTINARNNWWGTIDPGAIAQKIYDYMDSSNSPVVDFTPFLDGPNGNPIDGNFIGGPIATNTTWLRSQSPYIVIGNVTVNQGITLTIEPGVQVKFAGYTLTINGTLYAQGAPGQNIIFTSNKTTPAIGDWSAISFTDTSDDANCIISYAVIEYSYYGISLSSASPRIENNTIRYNQNGIYAYSSSSIITNNIIQNNQNGIHCESSSSPIITNNTIINNNYNGVYLEGSLTNYPNPAINNNSIYNNTQYNLYAHAYNNCSSITINAQNNWWGSIDPAAIVQKIYDNSDNSNYPVVSFTPFLDGPNGNPVPGNFVSGPINSNTIWTQAESPYIVIGNVTVNQGVTLTVEPGVQVKFSGNYQLIINGSLVAVGNPSQQITFTSNKATPAIGDWNRIYFADTSDDASCIISYAVIEYAGNGIESNSASPRIQNNTIQNNSSGIYYRYASTSNIANNSIINNSYGIVLNGDLTNYPNPTIHNNSIYNNSSFDFSAGSYSDCSSITIDAKDNWWGTTDGVAIMQKIYDYNDYPYSPVVDFTPFLDGPNGNPVLFIKLNEPIDNVLVPGVGKITFNATIDEPANWTIEIKDSLNVTVKTFTASNSTAVFIEWYGYMDDGVTLVGDGEYTYTINAVSVSLGIDALPIAGSILVNSGGPVSLITSPIENQVLAGASNQIMGTGSAFSGFNNYVLSYANDINYPEEYWVTLIDSPIPVIEGLLYTLDVTDFMSESYVLRLKTFNLGGQVSTDYIAIKVLNVFYVYVDPPAISPNNDGIQDTLTIYAYITLNSNWTLRIKDPNQTVVKTFTGSGNYISQIWDGKDEFNTILPDGQYTFQIEATDIQSGVTTFSNIGTIPVDTTLPTAEITSPTPTQAVTGEVPVIGTANDPNLYYYMMEYGLGQNPTSWNSFAFSYTPVVGGQLGLWNTLGLEDGDYTLRLTVGDVAGNVSTYEVPVIVDNMEITNVSVSPNVFNPSNSETVNINYTIEYDADVTITIQDLSYNAIRTIGPNPKLAGANTDIWDGKDNTNIIVSNNAYTFTIDASTGTNFGEYTPEYIPSTVGVTGFTADLAFNPHNNELCRIDYNLVDSADVLIKAGGTGNEDPNWSIVDWKPRVLGANTDYWNGRDQNGNIVDLSAATLAIWTRALPDEPIIVVSDLTANVSTDPYSFIPSYREVTTITYTISKAANVTVSIYYPDATLVKILENNIAKPAGTYDLVWDGSDSTNKIVAQEGDFTIKVEATGGDGKTATALGNVTVY